MSTQDTCPLTTSTPAQVANRPAGHGDSHAQAAQHQSAVAPLDVRATRHGNRQQRQSPTARAPRRSPAPRRATRRPRADRPARRSGAHTAGVARRARQPGSARRRHDAHPVRHRRRRADRPQPFAGSGCRPGACRAGQGNRRPRSRDRGPVPRTPGRPAAGSRASAAARLTRAGGSMSSRPLPSIDHRPVRVHRVLRGRGVPAPHEVAYPADLAAGGVALASVRPAPTRNR